MPFQVKDPEEQFSDHEEQVTSVIQNEETIKDRSEMEYTEVRDDQVDFMRWSKLSFLGRGNLISCMVAPWPAPSIRGKCCFQSCCWSCIGLNTVEMGVKFPV